MKRIVLSAAVLAAFCIASAGAAPVRSPNYFKAGEKICMIGDSIAHGGFYTENILLFYATRYPHAKIFFCNAGMSGQGVGGVWNRLKWDVYERYVPDTCIIMIGMNDAPRGMYAEGVRGTPKALARIESFHKNYPAVFDKVLASLTENCKRVVVFTPSIFDQTVQSKRENLLGCNDALGWAAEANKAAAKKYGAEVVDIWSYMTEMNGRYQQSDPTRSFIDFDRVHPRDLGGFVMMAKVVSDWRESGLVSEIRIDAAKNTADCENAEVSNLRIAPGRITFSAVEGALPFPTSAQKDEADKVLGFLPAFNREILQVGNLNSGKYSLKIDGVSIGEFSASQLASGVNLALCKNTPQYGQAKGVEKLSKAWRAKAAEHRDIVGFEIWVLKKRFDSTQAYLDETQRRIDAKELKNENQIKWAARYMKNKPREAEIMRARDEAFEAVYSAAKPAVHNFELTAVR
ncbi:MAG: hypothetical protein DBX55_01790 [Verrucomicrobia bacterium]|nr:MAG: hypothetical protein DBX55_01790 [Verrucomicrobiota bacterium]